MKPLPILSEISALAFGLATQLRMGQPVAIDNNFSLSSYDDIVLQYAFNVDGNNALIIYAAYKSDPFVDFMVDVSQLFNIVKNYFGNNFSSQSVSNKLNQFASVFNETNKDKIFSLSFKEIEGSVMLVKRFHPGFFDSNEEFVMGLIGMIQGFARNIYKDVVLSIPLSDNDRTYIYNVLTSINTLFPES